MEKLRVRPPFDGVLAPEFDMMVVDIKASSTREIARLRDQTIGITHRHLIRSPKDKVGKTLVGKGTVQIILFGCNAAGQSVTVITNYVPFVDVLIPYSLRALSRRAKGCVTPQELFNIIENSVLDEVPDAGLKYVVREAYPVFGFTSFSHTGPRKEKWLRISTKNAEAFDVLLRKLRSKGVPIQILRQNGIDPGSSKYISKLTLAFDKLGHDERFCSEIQVAPSGWVRVTNAHALADRRLFTTQIQCQGHVAPLPEKKDIAPIVYLSFDLECVPRFNDNFPKSEQPADVIAQIGISLAVHGKGIMKRIVVCLGDTAASTTDDGEEIIILSCRNETEVVQYFRKIVSDSLIDADVVTGYNIFDFDYAYMCSRAIRIEAFGQVSLREAFASWRSARDVARLYVPFKDEYDEGEEHMNWNAKSAAALKSRQILERWVGYRDDGKSHFANMPHAMRMLLDYETPEELEEAYREFSKLYDARFSFNYCSRIRAERTVLEKVLLKSSAMGSNELNRYDMTGRTSFDLYLHVKTSFTRSSYTLKSTCEFFLKDGQNKVDLPYKTMFSHWRSGDPQKRSLVAVYCSMDCDLVLKVIRQAAISVDLIEMSRFTYTPLPQLVTRGQQVKVYRQIAYYCQAWGFALNHIHVVPPESYKGATVLPPKAGYYREPIATLDFQSLYPGIMRSHNLCYSSWVPPAIVQRARQNRIKLNSFRVTNENGYEDHHFVDDSVFRGLLPRLLEELHGERRKVKKQMKQFKYGTSQYMLLNAKQLAIKVTMNSVYGFTGVTRGKMGCYPISATTTFVGRKMIDDTKAFCEANYDCEVIYGDSVASFTPMLLRVDGEVVVRRIGDFAKSLVFMRNRRDGKETCELSNVETLTSNGWVNVRRVIRHGTKKKMVRVTTNKGMICVTEDHSLIKADGAVARPKDLRPGDGLLPSKIILSVPQTRTVIPAFRVRLSDDSMETVRCSTELARLMASSLSNIADERLFFTTSPGIHASIYAAAQRIHANVTWHENTRCIIGSGEMVGPLRRFYQRECVKFPQRLLNGNFKTHQVEFVNHLIFPLRVGDPCLALTLRALIRVSTRRCTDCFYKNGFYHLDYSDSEEVTIMSMEMVDPTSTPVYDLTVPGKEQFDAMGHAVHNTDSVMVKFRSWPPTQMDVKCMMVQNAGSETLFTFAMENLGESFELEDMRFFVSFEGHRDVHLSNVSVSEHGLRAVAKDFQFKDGSTEMFQYTTGVTLTRNKLITPTKAGMIQAFEAGDHAAEAVTSILFKPYPAKILEMEKAMLGAVYYEKKKKYAQRAYEEKDGKPKLDVKGLPIVRRDNSPMMRYSLKAGISHAIPMEGEPLTHEGAGRAFREQIRLNLEKLLNRELPIDDYIITKSLQRIQDYKNPESMGHINLWKKMLQRIDSGAMIRAPPRAGDRIEYVVVEGPGKQFFRCEDPAWILLKKKEMLSKKTLPRPTHVFVYSSKRKRGEPERVPSEGINGTFHEILRSRGHEVGVFGGYGANFIYNLEGRKKSVSIQNINQLRMEETPFEDVKEFHDGLVKVIWEGLYDEKKKKKKVTTMEGWPLPDRLYYAEKLFKPAQDFMEVIGYSIEDVFKTLYDKIMEQKSSGKTKKITEFFGGGNEGEGEEQAAGEEEEEEKEVNDGKKAAQTEDDKEGDTGADAMPKRITLFVKDELMPKKIKKKKKKKTDPQNTLTGMGYVEKEEKSGTDSGKKRKQKAKVAPKKKSKVTKKKKVPLKSAKQPNSGAILRYFNKRKVDDR